MSIKLGTATVMASDSPESMHSKPQGFRVSISPSSLAEFDRIYNSLKSGAQSVADDEMAPCETFWAERFAMFTDRFGTPWMLNFEGNKARN